MATSGTYSFIMTRDSIIAAAFRAMEVYAAGGTLSSVDTANGSEALNIVAKGMVVKGLPLWCIVDLPVAMVAAQASYNIGPIGSQVRPLRILQAYLRDASGNDRELIVTSRYEYNQLGQKATQAQPNQLYYDPQFPNGIVTLYDVPVDNTATLHLVVQRQLQDLGGATDNPDFPQEAYQMLKWALADELSLEYGVDSDKRQQIAAKAAFHLKEFMDFEQDQSSSFFLPSGRRN